MNPSKRQLRNLFTVETWYLSDAKFLWYHFIIDAAPKFLLYAKLFTRCNTHNTCV